MAFQPNFSATDYSTMTAEQILEQKKQMMEEQRKLDIILKEKMESQRAGFVQRVFEQVQTLDMDPLEFIQKFKEAGAVTESAISAKDIFEMVNTTPAALEKWFADFNQLKNDFSRSSKTPFFKLPKMTRAGLSPDKFSIIYFEDIKGSEKGVQAIAAKVAKTRDDAMTKLAIDPKDERVNTVMDMLYPEVKEEPKATAKKATKN